MFDKSDEIIDIVCNIPIEEWTNTSNNGRWQTLFKRKCIELSKTNTPTGRYYITVHIDGIDFKDSNNKCNELYHKLHKYFTYKKETEIESAINSIYTVLKN